MRTGITAKKFVRAAGILLLCVIVVGYGLWRSRDILFGVPLSIKGITDGMTTPESILTFSGVAPHANKITVDGRTVAAALDGAWSDTLALLPGYNTITIEVTDRFNRNNSKTFAVYYSAPVSAPALIAPETPPSESDSTIPTPPPSQ